MPTARLNPLKIDYMKMQQTYCVFNDTLLPRKVAELQLQRSVSVNAEYAESVCFVKKNSKPGPEAAVQRLLSQAQEKGIQHPFSSDRIMHLLGRLIDTHETPAAEYSLRIYAANRPVLFIC